MRKIKQGIQKVKLIAYKETSHQPIDNLWSFCGAFIGIAAIGMLQQLFYHFEREDQLFLIGAFGASSVLLFSASNSPLAQPRNTLFGGTLSALVGVLTYKLFYLEEFIWLSPALSVALAILVMQYTKTLHPPGGAIALIANIGSEEIKEMGFLYVLNPIFSGLVVLLLVALLFNNISKNRIYPYREVNIRKLSYSEKLFKWKIKRPG
ncbi:HPP family protein [uncultured Cyclobacterium sp.]|uniref:HPP family protein n=1 Tax=uncultured Cyclobacterium sp. TaxID=453820 RepID=UPI0030EED31C